MESDVLCKELKYTKVYEDIKSKITTYKMLSGTQLLGVRELMEHYNVSYNTVSKALKQLENENLIRREHGKGIFVEQKKYWDCIEKEHDIIGVIVTDMGIPFFNKIIRYIEMELANNGYDIIIRNSDFDSELESKIIGSLIERAVKGIIIVPTFDNNNARYLESVDGLAIPMMYLIRHKSSYNNNYIILDDYTGAFQAVDYLIKNGHKDIGYIGGEKIRSNDLRFNGFCDCIKSRGLQINPDWIAYGKFFEVESGYSTMKKLLQLPKLPTAIFCYTDSIVVGAMKACKEADLKIPDDISLIGYNDDDISALVEPQITTMSIPLKNICMLAVRNILDLIKNNNGQQTDLIQVKVPVTLIERQSVKLIR